MTITKASINSEKKSAWLDDTPQAHQTLSVLTSPSNCQGSYSQLLFILSQLPWHPSGLPWPPYLEQPYPPLGHSLSFIHWVCFRALIINKNNLVVFLLIFCRSPHTRILASRYQNLTGQPWPVWLSLAGALSNTPKVSGLILGQGT